MPSRNNYKTEEAYQEAKATVRRRRKESRDEMNMKTVSEITTSIRTSIPELTEEQQNFERSRQSALRNEIADEYSEKLRRHLLRRWGSSHNRQVIIVINHKIQYSRNYMVCTISLTAYGAKLEREWLDSELKALGYDTFEWR